MLRIWLCLLALCAPMLALAEVPISDFAQLDDFTDVTISPQGEYIAAVVPAKDQSSLVVMRLSDGKMIGKFVVQAGMSVLNYSWVGPERIVAETAISYGALSVPQGTGELVGFNADGGSLTYLFGINGTPEVGTHINHVTKSRAWATVIDPLPKDPHHAIISVDEWPEYHAVHNDSASMEDVQLTTTYRLNVDNGFLDQKQVSPIRGYSHFLTDASGEVRYAIGLDAHTKLQTYFRDRGATDWTPVNTGELNNARVEPLRFSADGNKVYLKSNEGGDRSCLVEHDLKTNQRRKLSCDSTADLGDVFFSVDDEPLAAVYFSDVTRLTLLDTVNPMRAKLEMLMKAFPGSVVKPVSTTVDGGKLLIFVYSDRDPGAYYLFDTKTMKAAFLLARREAIKPEQMAERRPISFKTRDGQTIHGYLTLPPGKDPKNLPLVVHPHGGPIEIEDSWRWDAEPELLASRGYAVLQLNYRGSGGFGARFIQSGKQHWDSTMINDITDGTRWMIDQGFADPKRICIYGASYGGYAALMSAVTEPDLYRCTVAYAGVYDLNLWKQDTDVSESQFGRNYIADVVAATPEGLKQASPLTYIDHLKAAVMIVHGEVDTRVPFSQAKALRKALDDRHYPYEWLAKSDEGHGFYLPENREELYTRMLAFLDKNIGAGAANAAPAPVAAVPATSTPQADAGAAAAQKQ